MFAITLDENKYIKTYSNKFKTPDSILVKTIPTENDPEKIKCYQYIKNKFVLDADKWAAIEAKRAENARINEINSKITALKNEIESSDYQIIKCYEYALCNLPSPYDVIKLHEERQALRDEINELEALLKAEG